MKQRSGTECDVCSLLTLGVGWIGEERVAPIYSGNASISLAGVGVLRIAIHQNATRRETLKTKIWNFLFWRKKTGFFKIRK
jgi:hypothetical protein